MKKVEHLSNKELVVELSEIDKPWDSLFPEEELKRQNNLKEEILRRLNEPWRRQQESILRTVHNKELEDLKKQFTDEINSINYKSSIRHQLNIIKKKLDSREYYG